MPLRARSLVFAAAVVLAAGTALGAQQVPKAIYTDPPHNTQHPARMEVLHIPSGDVKINGVAYLAAGAGVHPTFVLLHGLPGNEKNHDRVWRSHQSAGSSRNGKRHGIARRHKSRADGR